MTYAQFAEISLMKMVLLVLKRMNLLKKQKLNVDFQVFVQIVILYLSQLIQMGIQIVNTLAWNAIKRILV